MKQLFFSLIFISLASMFFTACSKEDQVGKKISISSNFPDSSSVLFQGAVKNAESENYMGSVFVRCRYKTEIGLPAGIDVVVPKSRAANLSVGDTLYFIRVSVSSEGGMDHEPKSAYMGMFYSTDTLDLSLYGIKTVHKL
ncbi:MAG: hypothetical protein WC249_04105 [Patescibacteria group bacterium]|jgi:hypothetical protein